MRRLWRPLQRERQFSESRLRAGDNPEASCCGIIELGLHRSGPLRLFTVFALASVLVGPDVASRVARWFGIEPVFATVWAIFRWPVILGLVVLAVDLVYHFAPNRKARWDWISPGALVATALWVVGSFAFKLYLATAATFNATYGVIGGLSPSSCGCTSPVWPFWSARN